MQQAQVLTYGIDDVLAERLRELAVKQRFRLRETSVFASCASALRAAPSAFVLKLGVDIERELGLLEHVHACFPAMVTIVVGDASNPALEGLAWDLGTTMAIFPTTPIERMVEVITKTLTVAKS